MKKYIAEYIIPIEKKGNDCIPDFLNAKRLIRCKNCRYWGQDGYSEGCKYAVPIMTENDYCSMAERKEE